MDLLDVLASPEALVAGFGVVRLAAETRRQPSQVSRALAALEAEGLVERDPASRRYALGWRLYALAARTTEARLVAFAPQVVAAQVVADAGEAVLVAALDKPETLGRARSLGLRTPEGVVIRGRDDALAARNPAATAALRMSPPTMGKRAASSTSCTSGASGAAGGRCRCQSASRCAAAGSSNSTTNSSRRMNAGSIFWRRLVDRIASPSNRSRRDSR